MFEDFNEILRGFFTLLFITLSTGFVVNKMCLYFAYHTHKTFDTRWKKYRGSMLAVIFSLFIGVVYNSIMNYSGIFSLFYNGISYVMFVSAFLFFGKLENNHTDKIFADDKPLEGK